MIMSLFFTTIVALPVVYPVLCVLTYYFTTLSRMYPPEPPRETDPIRLNKNNITSNANGDWRKGGKKTSKAAGEPHSNNSESEYSSDDDEPAARIKKNQ